MRWRSLSNQPLSLDGREELGASWMKQNGIPTPSPTKSEQRYHQVASLGLLHLESLSFQ